MTLMMGAPLLALFEERAILIVLRSSGLLNAGSLLPGTFVEKCWMKVGFRLDTGR